MTGLAFKTHWLYRCYDADGFLLYIGITSDLPARMGKHRHANKALVERMATHEAEEFPDRASAFEAEALAIRRELPPMNIKHTEGNQRAPYRPLATTPHHKETQVTLESDYTLTEAAEALKVSTRWIRDRIKAGKDGTGPFVEHVRRGHKIMFTTDQVERLRSSDVQSEPVAQSVTTGRKRRAS